MRPAQLILANARRAEIQKPETAVEGMALAGRGEASLCTKGEGEHDH